MLLLALFACTGNEESDATLPEVEETGVEDPDTDVSQFPIDTSVDTDFDSVPLHTLTLHQWGVWDLANGPSYDGLTGTMWVIEYLDGDQWDTGPDTDGIPDTDLPPDCLVTYALTGVPAETSCDGCSFAFEVTFAVVEGEVGPCRDPELPEDGETHRFGFRASDDTIVLDYGDIGLWLPWYPAEKVIDQVTFDWRATLGVSIEEEEE